MSAARIEFAELMPEVCRRLLGDPNEKLSTNGELRYGSKGALAIDLEKGVFFDHEANEGGGVLDLIKRETDGGDPNKWLRDEGLIESKTIVTFDYRDENGALLFQACRIGRKFWQRRPNGGGDWIPNIEGVRRVLYQLPALIASTGTVFIPEGEKHVDALRKLGLRATCNPGGAGKWRRDYNAFLRDQDVVVLPDNDAVGHEHGQSIARSLHGIANRVRVLLLPDLKPKGDVINWLAAGGTVDELLRLADATAEWTPPSQTTVADDKQQQPAHDKDFVCDGKGNIVGNHQGNIRLALNKLGATLRHDVFQDRLLIDGVAGVGPLLDDSAIVRLWCKIARNSDPLRGDFRVQ